MARQAGVLLREISTVNVKTLIQTYPDLVKVDLTTYFGLFFGKTFHLLTTSGAFSFGGASFPAGLEAVARFAQRWLLIAAQVGAAAVGRPLML